VKGIPTVSPDDGRDPLPFPKDPGC
jgi:hypothetical protein